MCNTTGLRTFPLYQCYHALQRNMQKNLMYVPNVGKDLHTREAWTDTCWFTLVIVLMLALFATTKLHAIAILKITFASTWGRNHIPALTAIMNAQKSLISLFTFAHIHTQVWSVWEVVPSEGKLNRTSPHTHKCEVVCLRCLWIKLFTRLSNKIQHSKRCTSTATTNKENTDWS